MNFKHNLSDLNLGHLEQYTLSRRPVHLFMSLPELRWNRTNRSVFEVFCYRCLIEISNFSFPWGLSSAHLKNVSLNLGHSLFLCFSQHVVNDWSESIILLLFIHCVCQVISMFDHQMGHKHICVDSASWRRELHHSNCDSKTDLLIYSCLKVKYTWFR